MRRARRLICLALLARCGVPMVPVPTAPPAVHAPSDAQTRALAKLKELGIEHASERGSVLEVWGDGDSCIPRISATTTC